MIRRAKVEDVNGISELLRQIDEIHAEIRPDIFKAGHEKYTDEELGDIITQKSMDVFVYESDDGRIIGHAFCVFEETKNVNNMNDRKCLYIDDICIDEKERGKGIATALYQHVKDFAKENNCQAITLNVWEGNDSAISFYKEMGLVPLKTTMEQLL